MMDVTQAEVRDSLIFWSKHRKQLAVDGQVSTAAWRCFNDCVRYDNIGYGPGQLRPGELGQWDLYYSTEESLPRDQRLLLSGLTDEQVRDEETKDWMRIDGYDPDDPADVREYEYIQDPEKTLQELDQSVLDAELAAALRQLGIGTSE